MRCQMTNFKLFILNKRRRKKAANVRFGELMLKGHRMETLKI